MLKKFDGSLIQDVEVLITAAFVDDGSFTFEVSLRFRNNDQMIYSALSYEAYCLNLQLKFYNYSRLWI